ncbi:DUF167 domain-containing protein [bacterium]|nr:DUF167 domain-containing protein [bacterium]
MLIKIKVFPKAKKEKVLQIDKDKLNVWVKEAPKEGRANERVIELIADFLKIPQNKIQIIKGRRTPNKILKIFD